MAKDIRGKICDIMSKMLDNPDEYEIYPTTIAINELKELVREKQIEAIGWTYAYACSSLDAEKDLRCESVPDILASAEEALNPNGETFIISKDNKYVSYENPLQDSISTRGDKK